MKLLSFKVCLRAFVSIAVWQILKKLNINHDPAILLLDTHPEALLTGAHPRPPGVGQPAPCLQAGGACSVCAVGCECRSTTGRPVATLQQEGPQKHRLVEGQTRRAEWPAVPCRPMQSRQSPRGSRVAAGGWGRSGECLLVSRGFPLGVMECSGTRGVSYTTV